MRFWLWREAYRRADFEARAETKLEREIARLKGEHREALRQKVGQLRQGHIVRFWKLLTKKVETKGLSRAIQQWTKGLWISRLDEASPLRHGVSSPMVVHTEESDAEALTHWSRLLSDVSRLGAIKSALASALSRHEANLGTRLILTWRNGATLACERGRWNSKARKAGSEGLVRGFWSVFRRRCVGCVGHWREGAMRDMVKKDLDTVLGEVTTGMMEVNPPCASA